MGVNTKIKAVFLDRDGVLNKAVVVDGKPYPPKSLLELEIPQGVKEGLVQLKQLGFVLIVVTNQPDVARGTTSINTVNEINNHLKQELVVDDIFCCIHDSTDNCECRKPKPGMIFDASKKWNIDLNNSFMVGDRWKDIETGKNAGLKTILIKNDYDERYVEADHICYNFDTLVEIIKTYVSNTKSI